MKCDNQIFETLVNRHHHLVGVFHPNFAQQDFALYPTTLTLPGFSSLGRTVYDIKGFVEKENKNSIKFTGKYVVVSLLRPKTLNFPQSCRRCKVGHLQCRNWELFITKTNNQWALKNY
jgi:hypothetical protein